MKVYALIFGVLFVASLFHPHLAEKWSWVGQVLQGEMTWSERFRPIDSFDLVLHTGMSIAFLAVAIRNLMPQAE